MSSDEQGRSGGSPAPFAIEVEGLHKRYGDHEAVRGLSFGVRAGEVVGFLGPNGAGKTTVMRILTGFIPATDGTARIAGHDVFSDATAARRAIGYLPETPPLYPEMTPAAYVDFVARLKDVPRAKRREAVDRALERCGLLGVRRREIRQLSKGYRQRVGLAQAIVHEPQVLVLDEPTVGLDPIQIREIRALIRELAASGNQTVILSTHILPEVEAICQRVILIGRGRKILDQPIAELTAGGVSLEEVFTRVMTRDASDALEKGCVRHVLTIASRELRSLFVSPVAYVVLTLWSVIAGTFFLASLYGFHEQQFRLQQLQMLDRLETMNLNDQLIEPFIGSMWVIVLFLLPAVTMGLVASEKANGTDELLLTSPISIWDIVLGKFLAGVEFVTIMTAIAGFFPALLFFYGDPELGKTLSGMLCLWLVSVTYVAVGVFASSVTRNQLVAFIFTFVLLLILGMMLPFIVDISMSGSGVPSESPVAGVIRWMATGSHVDRMLQGLIDTSDLAYYAVASAIFLLLSKTVIESARWR